MGESSPVGRHPTRWGVEAPGPRRDRGAPGRVDPTDGHVAWAGDLGDPELPRALATWFGAHGQTYEKPTTERTESRSVVGFMALACRFPRSVAQRRISCIPTFDSARLCPLT